MSVITKRKGELIMPIPFILGAIAVAAGATGVAKGVSGAMKIKEAKEMMEEIERKHNENQARLEKQERRTQVFMDKLGAIEVETLSSFQEFSECVEKIQNIPKFKKYEMGSLEIEPLNIERLKEVSIGATALKGVIAGSALGTAGSFAAGGATTAAVSAFGVASTGTAISGLSGAAATNATLAALGGGSLAAGGGGVALGTTLLTGATLGIGLMVGGLFINHAGDKAQANVYEAREEYNKAKALIKKARTILSEIEDAAKNYTKVLKGIYDEYLILLEWLKEFVSHEVDWNNFTHEDERKFERITILVQILFTMCKVQFLIKQDDKNVLNREEIENTLKLIDTAV